MNDAERLIILGAVQETSQNRIILNVGKATKPHSEKALRPDAPAPRDDVFGGGKITESIAQKRGFNQALFDRESDSVIAKRRRQARREISKTNIEFGDSSDQAQSKPDDSTKRTISSVGHDPAVEDAGPISSDSSKSRPTVSPDDMESKNKAVCLE